MTTHVAIGCSSIRDYQFLAPMTGLLWRHRIGLEPIFLLAGNWLANRRGLAARTALYDFGFHCIAMTAPKTIEEATQAQNSRQHAALLPLFNGREQNWLMPSDVDLWPIRREFYYQHESMVGPSVVAYYANGDHYTTFPTCHVAMRIWSWRALYRSNPAISWEDNIEANVNEWLPTRKHWQNDRNFALWMSDQAMMTDRIRTWHKDEDIIKIERHGHPPVDRIDRAHWPDPYNVDHCVDAHMLRPADQDANWPRVFDLFKRLLPEHAEWAQKYRSEYIKGY